MSLDDLVRTITREVLRQLEASSAGPQILVLAPRDCASAQRLLPQLSPACQVVFLDDARDRMEPARTILPFLSCARMAELAIGRACDPVTEKVLATLLAGRAVEVFEFEYLQYRQTAPAALFSLYASCEEKLCRFGLQRFETGGSKSLRSSQSLVTERDVLEAVKQGASEMHLLFDTRLTPLAVDCARENGVVLHKSERQGK